MTIIQVGKYVFGGFVEQSWGGKFSEVPFGCTLLNLLLFLRAGLAGSQPHLVMGLLRLLFLSL